MEKAGEETFENLMLHDVGINNVTKTRHINIYKKHWKYVEKSVKTQACKRNRPVKGKRSKEEDITISKWGYHF